MQLFEEAYEKGGVKILLGTGRHDLKIVWSTPKFYIASKEVFGDLSVQVNDVFAVNDDVYRADLNGDYVVDVKDAEILQSKLTVAPQAEVSQMAEQR